MENSILGDLINAEYGAEAIGLLGWVVGGKALPEIVMEAGGFATVTPTEYLSSGCTVMLHSNTRYRFYIYP